jgi:hypothetical protein
MPQKVAVLALLFLSPLLPCCGQAGHPPSVDSTQPVPRACRQPELLAKGQPIFTGWRENIRLGVSLDKHEYKAGEKIPLHIWVYNSGDTRSGILTCSDLSFFASNGMALFRAGGQQVLSHRLAEIQRSCATDPQRAAFRSLWVCARNILIPISAHACKADLDSGLPFYLTDNYNLPPGRYLIQLLGDSMSSKNACDPRQQPSLRPPPASRLTFTVVAP